MKELIIDRALLQKNFGVIRQRAGGAQIMGVLKSNAYGLGLLDIARFLREAGVTRFAVGEVSQAAALRAAGFTQEDILLLRSTAIPEEIDLMLDNGVIATVGSQEAALALSAMAEKRSSIAEAHIKIDCGMGRYGFLPHETDKIRSVYEYMQGLAISGLYTHLPPALSPKKAAEAIAAFNGVVDMLRSAQLETGLVHALGSTALFSYKAPPVYDLVRVGAAFGGRIPGGRTGLSRVGTVLAPISDVRWVPAKTLVAERVRASKSLRIGMVPVGYADGFLVERPGRGLLDSLLRRRGRSYVKTEEGQSLPVLGKVGQNHMVLDLTDTNLTVGTLVSVEINPLFAGALPRRMQ